MRRIRGCVCLGILSDRQKDAEYSKRDQNPIPQQLDAKHSSLFYTTNTRDVLMCRFSYDLHHVYIRGHYFTRLVSEYFLSFHSHSGACGRDCVYTNGIIISWLTAVGSLHCMHHVVTSEPHVVVKDAEPALVWCPVS